MLTSDLRIADSDRDRVIEQLRRHAADGRLDPAELEERVARALAAKTGADLEPLLADLPAFPPPAPRRSLRPELKTYLATMVLLVAIWALTGMGYFWPIWPALGWGLALGFPGAGCGVKRPHAR